MFTVYGIVGFVEDGSTFAKEGDSIEKIARVLHESEETIKKWIDEQAIEEERRRKEAESN